MDHNPQGHGQGQRRGFHRGRRGSDRRGQERRGPQPQRDQQRDHEQHDEGGRRRNDVDVEQIMRDIRARIAQRGGVELTNQQIQDLAARRLESILDPRGVKPGLLDQLRRAAGGSDAPAPKPPEPAFTFTDESIYESHSGFTRFMRKLLRPILMLFFNPAPIVRALNAQAKVNVDAAARDAERDRTQAEWNALHYELLQRLVTEVARVTLENQSLALKVESLSAKVDFNERRVRGIEGMQHQARPSGRRDEREQPQPTAAAGASITMPAATEAVATADSPAAPQQQQQGAAGDAPRRRRRRRRGRRGSSGAPGEQTPGTQEAGALDADLNDVDAVEGEEGGDEEDVPSLVEPDSEIIADALAASEDRAPVQAIVAPEREVMQLTVTETFEATTVEPINPTPADPAAKPEHDPDQG